MRSLPARILLSLGVLTACSSFAHAAPVFSRLGAAGTRMLAATSAASGSAVTAAPGATLLRVDEDAISAFRAAGGGRLSVPDADGGTVDLDLVPLDILSDGASVTYTDNTGRHAFQPDVSLYKGHVAGEPTSWVVLSMGASGVLGTVERNGARWTLSPTQRMATHAAGGLGVHAFAPEGSLADAASRFECGINANNEQQFIIPHPERGGLEPGLTASPEATNINGLRFEFQIAVDCDYELYSVKFGGDLNAATSYILTLLGTVNLIYERDLEATLKFPYVNLWTTAADPYTEPHNNGAALTEMQGYWSANLGGVTRNVAHLISGRALGGGIAYIDAICGGAPGYGISAIDAAYSYPTATTTWDIEVVAHELGHNFGSFHTHSCQWSGLGLWPGGTLDSCITGAGTEASCVTSPAHLPPNKGTIMSYCHLISNVANGIRLEFHPVCVSRMRGVMSGCGVFTTLPPRNPIATNIATGVRLSWTQGGSSGVLRYSVLRSRFPLDLNPKYLGNTTLTQFDTPGLGTYYYRMRTVRSADSSNTSGELKATVCSLASAAPVVVGSQPTAALSEDMNKDGIQDVVLVTTGGGNLVTLFGQGAGGVGNGNFAAPVSVPTGSSPACLALLDVNGDGVLDAVVGAQGDNTLQIHFGVVGGILTGTFGPATPIATLTFAPTAIVVADFDEDGILDLAVAGGGTSLVTLRGIGTAGVPGGVFDAPVTVDTGSQTRGLLAYDFNGDGITDLAATGGGVRILFGNGSAGKGDGTFTLGPSYSTGASPNQMAVADFNADGIADLAVCNNGASSVSVLLGNGTAGVPDGTFAPALPATAGSGPNTVNIGDWDHNGIPDMAIASNNSSNASSILIGLGNGTFETAQTFATGGSSPAAIAVNDFNEDGTPDLLVCNRLGQSVTRQLAGCPGVLSSALAVTSPNGGETWIGGTEHTLTWTKGAGVMTVDLQRSEDGVNWRTLARGLPGTSYSWTATAPFTTTARMRVVDSHAAQFADASDADFTVEDPATLAVGDAHPTLALLGAWPNPARQDLSVALSLPNAESRGALELIDLSGRRVAYHTLTGLSAGRHQVTLLERHALTPGVYLVRLTLGGEVRSLKVAVLQ